MLTRVRIKDFALIADLTLEFGPNLNALTGETGAGKSIIIDAIGLLAGNRAVTGNIRDGAKSAYIEGLFDLQNKPTVIQGLIESGIEIEDDSLIVTREVTPTRSVVRLNSRAVPLKLLQTTMTGLIDIQGQSEQLLLIRSTQQMYLLDAYGNLLEHAATLQETVQRFRTLERQIATILDDAENRVKEIDLLRFQVEELEAAKLDKTEESSLIGERSVLANVKRLTELSTLIAMTIAPEDGQRNGAGDLAREAFAKLQEMTNLDDAMEPSLERLGMIIEVLEDLATEMRAYSDLIMSDSGRLEEVEQRLDLIENLKRKYGSSIDAMIEFKVSAKRQLEALQTVEDQASNFETERRSTRTELSDNARVLSQNRRLAATRLAAEVIENMKQVGMDDAQFTIELKPNEDDAGIEIDGFARRLRISEEGIDDIEFMVSTNPGEDLKPLSQVASGGEISRIMLAIKATLSAVDTIPTIIFDEVDQGIGSRSAKVIGEKLGQLARDRQVLCITHLPQVAAFADTHFFIEKAADDSRAITNVVCLNPKRRLVELAAMAGNGTGAIGTATELLEQATRWRESTHGQRS